MFMTQASAQDAPSCLVSSSVHHIVLDGAACYLAGTQTKHTRAWVLYFQAGLLEYCKKPSR